MNQRIAIIGASGYAGQEVLAIIRRHPQMQADLVMTGRPDHSPSAPSHSYAQVVQPLDLDALEYVDGVFVCTPHGASAKLAQEALARGTKVVDLSADFRLSDASVYEKTYNTTHPCPELIPTAVYGLSEHKRHAVKQAKLVANPGCYPTCVLLPLLPLLQNGLVDLEHDIIADCKSGVSGAGKTPSETTLYGNVNENFKAYAVGTHRHAPEMHEHAGTDKIIFVPHLLPMFRGMFATIYLKPKAGTTPADALACLDAAYAAERCIRLYDRGQPQLDRVQTTNYCDIGVSSCGDRLVLLSAIDNLQKGAAGQAVQNMNLMLGLDETAGLEIQ